MLSITEGMASLDKLAADPRVVVRNGEAINPRGRCVVYRMRRTQRSLLLRLAFLAPQIVDAIAAGRQPPELTAETLAERIEFPLLWTEQEQAVGISWAAWLRSLPHLLAKSIGELIRSGVRYGWNRLTCQQRIWARLMRELSQAARLRRRRTTE